MINFLFCAVLLPGTSKIDQTDKVDESVDLTQFSQIWPYSVFIEMNDVNNVICNKTLNFMTNSRRCMASCLGASKVDHKTVFATKWLNFDVFRSS